MAAVRPTTPDQWRQTIGVPLQARREGKHLSIREAARLTAQQTDKPISESTWRQVESGQRRPAKDVVLMATPNQRTQRLMAWVLDWPDEWLDDLLEGRHPAETPRRSRSPGMSERERPDQVLLELAQEVRELHVTIDDQRAAIEDLRQEVARGRPSAG